MRWVLAALFVLLVATALWLRWRRSSPTGGAAPPRPPLGGNAADFPFLAPTLPDASAMFQALEVDVPRVRRKTGGYRALLYRVASDAARADRLADHYTEAARVRAHPPGVLSLWDVWHRPGQRELVLRYARDHTPQALQEKLKDYTPGETDTNPSLVRAVLRACSRHLQRRSLRVVDAHCRWGGQLLGALASDCEWYHGYLPETSPAWAGVASALRLAIRDHLRPPQSSNEFWVREMRLEQAAPAGGYDVLFVHDSDLTPLRGDLVRRLGVSFVVLFGGSTSLSAKKMALAVALMKGVCRRPRLYGVRAVDGGPTERALLWKI